MVRGAFVAALAAAAALAGCGGSKPAATPSPAPQAATATATAKATPAPSKARVLVAFTQQRPGALIDKITVRADGTGVFDRPSGGVGRVLRDVIVAPSAMRRLRAGLAQLPAHPPKPRDGTAKGQMATYIMRADGRTYVAKEGLEGPRERSSMHVLAALLYGDGIQEIVDEKLGGVAGHQHSAGVGKVKRAPEYVFFQIQGAGGATLDTLSVRTDGTATHAHRYGGAGGRFSELRLLKGRMARLRRALATLPHGHKLESGPPPPPGGAQFLMRFKGRTLVGRRGAIAPRARPATQLLSDFLDGIGVVRTRKDIQTGPQ
jgi:hypothetical protein